MIGRVALPIVLATIIAVVVSFAVQGFISFVNLVSSYLRGDNHIFLGLPKEANHFPPLLKIVGTTAIVSTLLTIVGQPYRPTKAGKGGFNLG